MQRKGRALLVAQRLPAKHLALPVRRATARGATRHLGRLAVTPFGYHLVYAPSILERPEARNFIEWIPEEASQTEA